MLIGLAFGLAGYPLLDPDEGRNAEVAREMAAGNDYILPHLNQLPYLDKPIVFFGVTALSMEFFGPSVFAARLAPLFFTLLTLSLIWSFGNRLYGSVGGWIAAIATGTMPLTLAFARTVIFDSALDVLCYGGYCFLLYRHRRGRFNREPNVDAPMGPRGFWIHGVWSSHERPNRRHHSALGVGPLQYSPRPREAITRSNGLVVTRRNRTPHG